jgi:tetratricopeptide (TPR) repeat protein/WD40 repeat protein
LSFVAAGAIVAGWVWQRRTEINVAARGHLTEAQRLTDEGRFEDAQRAARQAKELARSGLASTALRTEIDALLAGLQDRAVAARADRDLLAALADVRTSREDDFGDNNGEHEYAAAYAQHGLDPDRQADAFVERVSRRPEAVRVEIATALDDWAFLRMYSRRGLQPEDWRRLLAVSRRIDPDPARGAFRAVLGQTADGSDRERLKHWAATSEISLLPAASIPLLARALSVAKMPREFEAVLREGVQLYPQDVWINYDLGMHLSLLPSPRWDEVIRFLYAARAIRPEVGHQLAHVLAQHGYPSEGEALFRDLCHRRPANYRHHNCLAHLLFLQRKFEEAIIEYRKAMSCKPDDVWAYHALGQVLVDIGKPAEAEVECRKGLLIQANSAPCRMNLAAALSRQGREAEAVKEYQQIPSPFLNAVHHYEFGNALAKRGEDAGAVKEYQHAVQLKKDFPEAYTNLGNALRRLKKPAEAEAAYKNALLVQSKFWQAHFNYGILLVEQKRFADAEKEFRAAVANNPDHAEGHERLGDVLSELHKYDEAEKEYSLAIRIQPVCPHAHYNLARALARQGKTQLAIKENELALEQKEDYAEAHCNLGHVLIQAGRIGEAVKHYQRGHELGSRRADWNYQSEQWLKSAKQLAKLDEILAGKTQLGTVQELMQLARAASHLLHRYAATSQLFVDTLKQHPDWSDYFTDRPPFYAASTASMAAAGKGDGADLSPEQRARWRKQALIWLREECAYWAAYSASGEEDKLKVTDKNLTTLLEKDDWFAGVREEKILAALPERERKEWTQLWSDLASLREKVRWSALAPATKPAAELKNKVAEVRRFRWYEPRDYFHSNIDLSPDGRLLLASVDIAGPTKVWDVRSGQLRYELAGGKAAFLPEAKQILTLHDIGGGFQNLVFTVYDIETGRLSRQFGINNPRMHTIWLAPDGKTLVSLNHPGTLQLWDVERGKEVKRWVFGGRWPPVLYSPESSHILLSTNAGGRAWDVAAKKETDTFTKVANRPRLIALLPGARQVVESNTDSFAVLDVATGAEVRRIRWDWKVNDEDAILGNLSVDSWRMLTFHKDQTVRLYEDKAGRFHELGRITLGRNLVPYSHRANIFGRATHLCFSADGRYAAAASNDGDLIVLRLPDPPPAKDTP